MWKYVACLVACGVAVLWGGVVVGTGVGALLPRQWPPVGGTARAVGLGSQNSLDADIEPSHAAGDSRRTAGGGEVESDLVRPISDSHNAPAALTADASVLNEVKAPIRSEDPRVATQEVGPGRAALPNAQPDGGAVPRPAHSPREQRCGIFPFWPEGETCAGIDDAVLAEAANASFPAHLALPRRGGAGAEPVAGICQPADAHRGRVVRIMQWNVFNGIVDRRRFARVAAWVRGLRPDVLGLNELNGWTDELLRRRAARFGFPHSALLQTNGSAYHVGLMSRHPFRVVARLDSGSPMIHGLLHAWVPALGMHILVRRLHPAHLSLCAPPLTPPLPHGR